MKRFQYFISLLLSLALLAGCSSYSVNEILLTNYDIKQVEVVQVDDLPALNLSGPAYTVAKTENPKKSSDIATSSGTSYDYEKLVFVGDSRTCGMYTAITGSSTSDNKIVYKNSKKTEYYVCKVSQGFSWFKDKAKKEVDKLVTDKTAVVIWLGINDIAGAADNAVRDIAKKYAEQTIKFAKDWNCDVYYLAVTPSDLKLKKDLNDAAKIFNKTLANQLGTTVKFLDAYSYVEKKLKSGDYKTDSSMHVHYDNAGSQGIYNFVKEKVGSIGESSSSGGTDSINGLPKDAFFFTEFESGTEAYRQTGGDSGNACGKYQFDYRYSLKPFLVYCKQQDKDNGTKIFQKLWSYADLDKSALQGNQSMYKAWQATYDKHPKEFKAAQDAYAYSQYYVPACNSLKSKGISIDKRADVIKGVIFSYSIQHGQETAAGQIASVVNNSMSDKQFIKKVYEKRSNTYPAYRSRYDSECSKALGLL